jgi:predicted NBD/HSP70 family sugar kinase
VGRKAEMLRFVPSAKNVLIIAIHAGIVTAKITDLGGNEIIRRTSDYDPEDKSTDIRELLVELVGSIMDTYAQRPGAGISAVGVCLSGFIRGETEIMLSRQLRMHHMSGYDLLGGTTGDLPLYLQDISRMRAFSQLESLGLQEKNIIFVDFCDGIGVTNIYEGHVTKSVAGEIGHTTVDIKGPKCFCGNRGCLELMCSGKRVIEQCRDLAREGRAAILREIMKADGTDADHLSLAQINAAAEKGDRKVLGVLGKTAEYLGIGIASTINMFNPKKVVINCDELMRLDIFYDKVIMQTKKHAYADFIKELTFSRVVVSTDETIRGMVKYMCDKIFNISSVYL